MKKKRLSIKSLSHSIPFTEYGAPTVSGTVDLRGLAVTAISAAQVRGIITHDSLQ